MKEIPMIPLRMWLHGLLHALAPLIWETPIQAGMPTVPPKYLTCILAVG